MREVDFSHRTLRKQWIMVNDWFEELALNEAQGPEMLPGLMKAVMELGMSLKRYQVLMELRAQGVTDKGNGYYTRSVETTFGTLQDVSVPRLRHHRLNSSWFVRYQRRWKKVDQLLLNCLMGGLSTRKAVKIMNRHFNWSLSPTTISRLSSALTEALSSFRHCPLKDEYVGLIIDGAWYRFRQLYGPKRVVLAVLGIKEDGTKVLLGFHVARQESALEMGRLLNDLKQRGLSGRNLKIICSDGSSGLQAAASEIFPWVAIQRCCWHHLQTLKNHADHPKAARRMMKEAAKCYRSGSLKTIQAQLQRFIQRWQQKQPEAIKAFADNLEQTLSYLALHWSQHRWFRTTNLIERLFRDLRSRTKLIASFDQPVHLEHFIIGIVSDVKWINLPCRIQPFFQKDTII